MAIVTIGAPLSGIRGTIGGTTFSANKSGPYAKQLSQPSNPRTPRQQLERGFMARMPALWNDMSGAQRAAWNTFADLAAQELFNSLGEGFFASGFNWFTKTNIRLLRAARSTIVPVPTQARPAAPTIDAFRVTVAGTDTDLTPGGTPSASTSAPAQPASNAFDDSVVTDWRTLFPSNPTGWIRNDLASPQNITHYSVRSSFFGIAAQRPTGWVFQVFTSAAWTTIHTVTATSFAATEKKDFYIPNAFTETNYRLFILANGGDPDQVAIAELEMFVGDEGASVIAYPEDEFADSPDFDLVLHISLGRGPGLQVQYPGFLEIIVNTSPGRWFQLIQTELETIFGTIQLNRTWFAELYRQTTQGIRSAPQTAFTQTLGP